MYTVSNIIIAIIWGIFAVYMQKKVHPTRSDNRDLFLTYAINGVFWPISMIWATVCYIFKISWAKNL